MTYISILILVCCTLFNRLLLSPLLVGSLHSRSVRYAYVLDIFIWEISTDVSVIIIIMIVVMTIIIQIIIIFISEIHHYANKDFCLRSGTNTWCSLIFLLARTDVIPLKLKASKSQDTFGLTRFRNNCLKLTILLIKQQWSSTKDNNENQKYEFIVMLTSGNFFFIFHDIYFFLL